MIDDGYPHVDAATYRHILGHYPTGVCVVTARSVDGETSGMVVGSFTSVSLNPPLVAFFPDRSSTSWPKIARVGRFCVNILTSTQGDLCRRFAAKGDDKFTAVSHRLSTGGSPVLDDVVAWIDCTVHAVHEAGDHLIVLGRVLEFDVSLGDAPMLFFRGQYGHFAAGTVQARHDT